MKASVFVGVSVVGFIARANGGLDFLDAGGEAEHGYDEFMSSVDTMVIELERISESQRFQAKLAVDREGRTIGSGDR